MSIAENDSGSNNKGFLANLRSKKEENKRKKRAKKIKKVADKISGIEPDIKKAMFAALKAEVSEAFDRHAKGVENGVTSNEVQLQLDLQGINQGQALFYSPEEFNSWAVSFEEHVSIDVVDKPPREGGLIRDSSITLVLSVSQLFENFSVWNKHLPVADVFHTACIKALDESGFKPNKKPKVQVTTVQPQG